MISPSPWNHYKHNYFDTVRDRNGGKLAEVYGGGLAERWLAATLDERRANGAMMAAAPDLLLVLRKILDEVDLPTLLLDAADAVISKALGEPGAAASLQLRLSS